MTLPRLPLSFKQPGRETVFARDAVKAVKLRKQVNISPRWRGQPTQPDRWELEVNDITVYVGTEKGARYHQKRALKYIR